MVQRPGALTVGAPAGDARAAVVDDLSTFEAEQVLEKEVEPEARLMSDEWKAFIAVGRQFAGMTRFGIQRANMFAARSMSIPLRVQFKSQTYDRRRLSPYQFGICRPLFS